LSDAKGIAEKRACVYATGSFGREEASAHSDLDLFIVTKSERAADGSDVRLLKRLNEIRLKADLIEVADELGFPEFSGDGRWLTTYSVNDLTNTLGKSEDDALNTFTARLLLLLESKPLLEAKVYREVIEDVIAAYWRDFPDHKRDFVPAFLANDILRLWRTFCVNYEANTLTEPSVENAKRKLKNYKLKHSRLLTCYSALVYLLAVYRRSMTVTPDDVLAMISFTPTQRFQWLLEQRDQKAAHPIVRRLLEQYELFLKRTNEPEAALVAKLIDETTRKEFAGGANILGEAVFEAVNIVGNGSKLHRILVV
jgi:predicted nucleotidyltransferase